MEPGETADQFIVSGRGALHISILMENMRREGYEFAVGPPKVRSAWPHICCMLRLPCTLSARCQASSTSKRGHLLQGENSLVTSGDMRAAGDHQAG